MQIRLSYCLLQMNQLFVVINEVEIDVSLYIKKISKNADKTVIKNTTIDKKVDPFVVSDQTRKIINKMRTLMPPPKGCKYETIDGWMLTVRTDGYIIINDDEDGMGWEDAQEMGCECGDQFNNGKIIAKKTGTAGNLKVATLTPADVISLKKKKLDVYFIKGKVANKKHIDTVLH